jgi:hypothetical protein
MNSRAEVRDGERHPGANEMRLLILKLVAAHGGGWISTSDLAAFHEHGIGRGALMAHLGALHESGEIRIRITLGGKR